MISYERTQSQFGWPATTGFAPDHGKPNPVNTRVHVFREGGVYGMVDGHAKWRSSRDFNGNASKPHMYAGVNYPSSPYMVVLD
jgi:hypothetical protein